MDFYKEVTLTESVLEHVFTTQKYYKIKYINVNYHLVTVIKKNKKKHLIQNALMLSFKNIE